MGVNGLMKEASNPVVKSVFSQQSGLFLLTRTQDKSKQLSDVALARVLLYEISAGLNQGYFLLSSVDN